MSWIALIERQIVNKQKTRLALLSSLDKHQHLNVTNEIKALSVRTEVASFVRNRDIHETAAWRNPNVGCFFRNP